MNIVGGRETNQDTNQDTNITFSNTMVSKCNLDSRNHFSTSLLKLIVQARPSFSMARTVKTLRRDAAARLPKRVLKAAAKGKRATPLSNSEFGNQIRNVVSRIVVVSKSFWMSYRK